MAPVNRRPSRTQPVDHCGIPFPAFPLGPGPGPPFSASSRMVDHLPFAPAVHPDQVIGAAGGATIRIRPLTTVEDGRACVDLQRHVWGWDQADVVPATLLHIVEYVGGLAAGAFDQHGALLGFVFG